MIDGLQVFDADAHVIMSPKAWETLPEEYAARRPRPVRVGDGDDMGAWTTGWLFDGCIEPHTWGPGTQAANSPENVMSDYGATIDHLRDQPAVSDVASSLGSLDLSEPAARIHDMDQQGIDIQVVYPTTLYARASMDPGFEAALFRAYNRYVAGQCTFDARRLKWAGLLPLRDVDQGIAAAHEMKELGASSAVIFGTARDKLISDPAFTPVWDEFAKSGLPIVVHMGMSWPPFDQLTNSFVDAACMGMNLGAQIAFYCLVGHGMMDRYPDLKVAFMEMRAEWLFFIIPLMEHYIPVYDRPNNPPLPRLPKEPIRDYAKSGRIFVGPEADDELLLQEMELLGEGQILFSSDVPHGEMRENAAKELLDRADLTTDQKRKILYDNPVRFYGEP